MQRCEGQAVRLYVKFYHRQSGDSSGRPRGLEIEAARDAIDVEAFAGKVEARDELAFHGFKIDFFEPDPAAGDEIVFSKSGPIDLIKASLLRAVPSTIRRAFEWQCHRIGVRVYCGSRLGRE